jgi:hypothetical protein
MELMNGFSEESGGVGGVKGVEMLRNAVPDLPQGVSGASQISLKRAAGDTVETVDVDDKHEKVCAKGEMTPLGRLESVFLCAAVLRNESHDEDFKGRLRNMMDKITTRVFIEMRIGVLSMPA